VGDYALTELLTQEEIGQLVGLRRETVNRLLRKNT
jgi:DNA-binding XRE family transcriptional regulator